MKTLVLILILPLIAFAQSAEELRTEIASQQTKLDALNKEIAQYEKELSAVGAKRQTLQSTVDALTITAKKTQATIRLIQNKISTTELEILELSGGIVATESAIALNESAVGEMLRTLQAHEDTSIAEQVLANSSISTLWDDAEMAVTVHESLRERVSTLESAKAALAESKTSEEKKQQQLLSQRADLKAEEQSLSVQKKEQQNLLSVTKSQESNYQALLKDKQAARATFERALNELESKLEYTLDPSRLPPSGKGVLRWPLDNVVITQQFGKTADSKRLYSSGTHNGVDFRASIGTPVKSALSGSVQGTGNSDAVRGCYSYGKWVLIRHENGLTTLYAHLSQINVSEGQEVDTSQIIGYSGATGYATGPHLHFGVYASNAVQVRQLGTKTACGQAIIPVSPTGGYLNPLEYL